MVMTIIELLLNWKIYMLLSPLIVGMASLIIAGIIEKVKEVIG